jgi:hypothetical protein
MSKPRSNFDRGDRGSIMWTIHQLVANNKTRKTRANFPNTNNGSVNWTIHQIMTNNRKKTRANFPNGPAGNANWQLYQRAMKLYNRAALILSLIHI